MRSWYQYGVKNTLVECLEDPEEGCTMCKTCGCQAKKKGKGKK